MKNKYWISLGALLLLAGCEKNPIDRLTNPMSDGALSQSSGTLVIYDDEVKTAGGLGFIPHGENQSVDVRDAGSPRRTVNQIRYSWNGQDVLNGATAQHLFAGFSLPITSFLEDILTAQPKNLSSAGYTKMKFFIRGTLSDRCWVRIEGPGDGNNATATAQVNSRRQGDVSGGDFVLSEDWQEVTLTVPVGGASDDFSDIKTFLTVSVQFDQPAGTTQAGGGGVIYLDDIRYVQ